MVLIRLNTAEACGMYLNLKHYVPMLYVYVYLWDSIPIADCELSILKSKFLLDLLVNDDRILEIMNL